MPPPALQAEEPLLRTPSGESASVEAGVDEAEGEGDEIGEACDAAVAPGPKRKASAIEDLDILISAMDGRAAEQKAKKAGAKATAKATAKAEASTGDDDGGDEAGEEAAPKKAVVPKKAAKKDGPVFNVSKTKNEARITRDGKIVERFAVGKGKPYDTMPKAFMAAIRRTRSLRKEAL